MAAPHSASPQALTPRGNDIAGLSPMNADLLSTATEGSQPSIPSAMSRIEDEIDSSNAMLELKVSKLKRALASTIERQNQLQEDNKKLRRLLDSAGISTDTNKQLVAMYQAKVGLFLSFLREEDPDIYHIADLVLSQKLMIPDEMSSKAEINHELTLLRQRRAEAERLQEEKEAKRLELKNEKAAAAGAGRTSPGLLSNSTPRARAGASGGKNQGSANDVSGPTGRRGALRPKRLQSIVEATPGDGVVGGGGIDVDGNSPAKISNPSAASSPKKAAAAIASLEARLARQTDELNRAANSVSHWKAVANRAMGDMERMRHDLSQVVLFQLKKSATAQRAQNANRLSWEDAPGGTSPGPAILREAVTLRRDHLGIGRAPVTTTVQLPSMPNTQSKLQMRSRYGYFSTAPGPQAPPFVGDATSRSPPHRNALSPSRRQAKTDGDVLAGAMQTLAEETGRRGVAFRVALSAHLEDVANIVQRAEQQMRRLEDVHDRLHEARVKAARVGALTDAGLLSVDGNAPPVDGPGSPAAENGASGSASPTSTKKAAPLPPTSSSSKKKESVPVVPPEDTLSIEEINGMADIVAADLDTDVPDSLTTNPAVRELLSQDTSWAEEAALLSLHRRTLLDVLQRRVDHAKGRIGSLLDVRYDPRKLHEAVKADTRHMMAVAREKETDLLESSADAPSKRRGTSDRSQARRSVSLGASTARNLPRPPPSGANPAPPATARMATVGAT